MRIISGKYKGRQIHPPKSFRARPTTDYAKEALFNIIENTFDIPDLHVLDLFGGTGNISYEFASREAQKIIVVEKDRVHASFIIQTAKNLGFDQIKVICTDVFIILKKMNERFNLIFCDPPYDMKKIETLPGIILEKNMLMENGWLIIEHSSRVNLKNLPGFFEHRYYGSVNFSFFKPL